MMARRPQAGFLEPGLAICLLIILGIAGATTRGGAEAANVPKAKALFAFGDSYADTGNLNRSISSSWKYPYGITWPGHPTGRFSNGHIQTDYLADVLGLPSPIPYVDSALGSIKTGINFACGGSGVTFAYGAPPIGSQIDYCELVLRTGVYSPSFLASSVVLVSNVGNDYSPLPLNATEIVVLIKQVVEGVALGLGRLYSLGFRNILVANLPPLSCIPKETQALNYTSCFTSLNVLFSLYNGLLEETVAELNKLPDASLVILDELSAFNYVLNNSAMYGITEPLVPCCRPFGPQDSCGDFDLQGNPLFSLCDDPSKYTYWDSVHPVESTWQHIINLFESKPGFLLGARTLESWLDALNLNLNPAPAPAPSGLLTLHGAAEELETAYNVLVSAADYSEAIGLLRDINLEEYLAGYPEQKVTVFLPVNTAFFSVLNTAIDEVYARNQVLDVVGFHTVKGYYDSSQFTSGMKYLTTVSDLKLLVNTTSVGVLVGPEAANIVNPDLYNVEGRVVIHGIDKILFPPGVQ